METQSRTALLPPVPLQRQWLAYSLHGNHERCVEFTDSGLILSANETRSGAVSRAWFRPHGWELRLSLEQLSVPETSLVVCLYSGIEYLPNQYENRIEFEVSSSQVTISAANRQFYSRRQNVRVPADIRLFCSMEGELTLILNDRPINSFDQRILLDGAQLLIYARGTGTAEVCNIHIEDAEDAWNHSHPSPVPRAEFPNPLYRRDTWWHTLNGDWEFLLDPYDEYGPEELRTESQFPMRIKVPFPWQSRYSGVRQPAYMGRAWYRRGFHMPVDAAKDNERVYVNFVASDYETHVWVNGQFLGVHKGGFSCFSFDITDCMLTDSENQILVMVEDPQDSRHIPVGKQGTWYTRSSGIWQSVYLQALSPQHVHDLRMITDIDSSKLLIEGRVEGDPSSGTLLLEVRDNGRHVANGELPIENGAFKGDLEIPNSKLWSPDHPHLYDLTLKVHIPEGQADVLHTYFGMRKIHHEGRRLMLNNKPLYVLGALNQAFHPDGYYNYPDAETIRNDVVQAKALGLNLFRVHIKVDDPLLYYYMDKIGFLAWQDLPSLDDRGYNETTIEQNENLDFPEDSGKFNMVRDARDLVVSLRNHPSVIIWSIINEGWGIGGMYKEMATDFDRSEERQSFIKRMYRFYHELDQTRFVVDNSPCEQGYSHVKTDILEYHFYANHIAHAKFMTHQEEYGPWREMIRGIGTREQLNNWFAPSVHEELTDDDYNRPIIISEYGPWPGMPWHEQDISVFLKFLTHQIMLNPEISGYVVTEYQDIEWERNGLVRYDRGPKKFGFDLSKIVFNPVIPLVDAPPFIHAHGGTVELPLFLSNYLSPSLSHVSVQCELHGISPFGFGSKLDSHEKIDATDVEFGLRHLGNVQVPLRNHFPLYWYQMKATNDAVSYGKNIIFIEDVEVSKAAKEDPAAVNLEQFLVEADRVEEFKLDERVEVIGFYGSGRILLWLPQGMCPKALILEMSTCPEHLFLQTKAPEPAVVEVYFNETKIHEFVAPPAKASFDGYLSQINSYRWGMYGEIVTVMLSTSQCQINRTNRLIMRTPSNQGLVIYSNRAGRFPNVPMMMF